MNQFLRITGSVLLLIGLGLTPQPADAAAYLKIGDIKGESQDREHQGWSDIESFSQSAMIEDAPSGNTRRRSCPVVSPLKLEKNLDSASIPMQFAMLRGRVFPTAEFELTRDAGDGPATVYLRYELQNAFISSYSISGSADSIPVDSFSLNFEKIKVEYIPQNAKGGSGQPVVDEYEVSACR